MFRRNFNFAIVVITALMLIVPISSRAGQEEAGTYPDIGIMNSVLRQLLREAPEKNHRSFEVSGSYLPGYGLLFVVSGGGEYPLPGPPVGVELLDMKSFDSSMAVFDSTMRRYTVRISKRDSAETPPVPNVRIHPPRVVIHDMDRKDRGELSGKALAAIDKQVAKFLESYADAENKLQPNEQVRVVLFTGAPSSARIYTVTRKQISDYRSGNESASAFANAVRTVNIREKHESLDIMETIIDKSIGAGMHEGHGYLFGPRSRGVYIEGLGAFFVGRMSELPDFDGKKLKSGGEQLSTSKLEDRILKTIGTYGPSLEFLRDGESVVVSVKVDRFGTGDEDILVGLRKKDIQSYSRNELSLAALRQRAIIAVNK